MVDSRTVLKHSLLALCIVAGINAVHAQDAGSHGPSANTTATPAPASADGAAAPDASAGNAKNQGVRSGQSMTSLEVVNVNAAVNSGGLMSPENADKAESDLTAQALRKMSAVQDPVQAMSSIPGVFVSSSDPAGLTATTGFMVNGFDGSRLSYTLDGVPMNEAADYNIYPTFLGDTQNVDDLNVAAGLSDIDAPSISAEGGHISLITRQPSATPELYVEGSIGNNDVRKGFVRLDTGQTGPLRSWVSFSRTTSGIWQGPGELSSSRVQAKSVLDLGGQNSISMTAMYLRTIGNNYFMPTKAQFEKYGWDYGYSDVAPQYTTTPGKADNAVAQLATANSYVGLQNNKSEVSYISADGEFQLADRINLSVIPYFYMAKQGGSGGAIYLSENVKSPYGLNVGQTVDLNHDGDALDTVPAYLYVYSNIWRPGINTKINYSGDNNNVTAGIWYEEYRKSEPYTLSAIGDNGLPVDRWSESARYRLPDGTPIDYDNYYVKSASGKAYLADSYTINEQWKASAGISYNHLAIDDYIRTPGVYRAPNPVVTNQSVLIHEDYSTVQGDIGVSYTPDDNNNFFFHSSTGYRPPIAKAYWSYTASNIDTLQRVKPETTWTNQLGWRFNEGNFMASTTLLDVNYKNYQTQHYDEFLQLSYFNAGAVQQYGLLSEASWRFDPHWTAYGSYTYLHATQQDDFISNTANGAVALPTDGKRMAGIPQNMLAMSLEYDLDHAFLRFSGKYNGARYGDLLNTEKVGGYTTFDFNAGYTFSDWGMLGQPQLRLSVNNLFDKHYLGYVYSTTTNAVAYKGVAASAPTYLSGQPRFEMLTLSFNLK
ncbi:TonB-dependent receptor [Dyella sp. C11]|uniref:TonB-dependent receptor n=1 Tax=Dyella sp. C11 TaxID=2126991 RepID=UPI000D6523FD|nr:TonB-dependent receptor [Dyella sp. C11]